MPDTPQGTTAAPATPKIHPCACLTGWLGEGLGSSLNVPDDQAQVCDRMTAKTYAQGHDAKASSRLAKELAAGQTDEETVRAILKIMGGSLTLVNKTIRSAQLRREAAERKKAPKAPRVAKPKAAQADQADEDIPDAEIVDVEPENDTEPAAQADVVTRIDEITGEAPAEPQPGDLRTVTHGKREFRAVVTEFGDDLRLTHEVRGGQVCLHQLNGTFIATARKGQ